MGVGSYAVFALFFPFSPSSRYKRLLGEDRQQDNIK
jgi:hypothetical protein